MNVGMGMRMRVFVGVHKIIVAMHVAMNVGMLQADGIVYHDDCSDNHNGKSDVKPDCRTFSQNQHTKGYTQKRGDRVVSTGFCGTQMLLGLNIQIDT